MKPHITALAALAAVIAVPACDPYADCTRTTTTARAATKVNVGALSRSAVVEARLTTGTGPLAGQSLRFEILDDGSAVYTTSATTGSDGTARADLKRADADALLAIARGDAFAASYGGNSTYCSSSDRAGFHATR